MPSKKDYAVSMAKSERGKESAKQLVAFAEAYPRLEIAYALQLTEDPVMRQLGDALTDQAFDRMTLATMARNYGVSFKKIAAAFFETRKDEGMIRMGKHLPQIMEDMAVDSLSKDKQCPICDGTGWMEYEKRSLVQDDEQKPVVPEYCKECGGTGLIRISGDTNARKMVMEASGLSAKAGINVDARSLTVNGADALEDTLALVKKVRDVQQGSMRVIEASSGPL